MAAITHHAKLILHSAITLVKKHAKSMFSYVLALYVPVLIYSIITSIASNSFIFTTVLSVILMVIQIWVGLALTKEIAERYEEQPARDIQTQLSTTKQLILPSIWISILTTLIVLGGTLLFIIPGIIFSVWYMFGNVALVLEGKNGMTALKQSKHLVHGRWWQVFFAAVLPTIAIILLLILIDTLLSFVFGIFNMSLVIELISSFISYLVSPIFTAIFVILYIELRKSLQETSTPEIHA